jgi:hypothetical protein
MVHGVIQHAHPQYSIDFSSIEHLSEGTKNTPCVSSNVCPMNFKFKMGQNKTYLLLYKVPLNFFIEHANTNEEM